MTPCSHFLEQIQRRRSNGDRLPKVAIIGTRGYPSYYGGFETAVRHLAPYLASTGWEVDVYGRAGSTERTDESRDLRISSIETRGLESKSLSTLSYGFTASFHASRGDKPDVALVMNVANGFFLPMLRAARIPTLVNVDGIEWERQKWGLAAKSMFKLGARLTARLADEIVVDAEEIGRRWRDDFGRSGVFIPYGGVDPGKLPPAPGFTSGDYVLLVARFVPENSVPQFLDAAEQISKRSRVVLVGSSGYGGELDERARSLAARNAQVTWLGHVSDDAFLFALMQHSAIYFHGHSVGGTNPALVQAMACGAPIVARDTVYNREVLGETALFVDGTSSAISDGVLAALRDKETRDRLRGAARRRSAERYSWDLVCSRYDDALRGLIRESSV